jgi:hypothetical protein
MAKTKKNIPKTQQEITDNNIKPAYEDLYGKLPADTFKRANSISRRGDEIKTIHIGFEDIDSAVIYYFKEVIRPFVMEDDNKVNVPVIYASPERWKTAQQDGYLRDKEGQILFPLITIKRDSMEKNRMGMNKLDGNKVHNYLTYEKRYSRKNQYDHFSAVTNRIPVKEFTNISVPDYYTITYSCGVYCSMMEDMNKILEAVSFKADSYWGEPEKFRFKARIDSYPVVQEMVQGEDRKITCTFSIILNGYVLPDSIVRSEATVNKYLSKAQVIFKGEEVIRYTKVAENRKGTNTTNVNQYNVRNNVVKNFNTFNEAQQEVIHFTDEAIVTINWNTERQQKYGVFPRNISVWYLQDGRYQYSANTPITADVPPPNTTQIIVDNSGAATGYIIIS